MRCLLINQAFAKIFVVSSSTAIVLWSLLIVKSRALSAAIGIYGLLLGPAVIIAMVIGGLKLDVQINSGRVAFSQAVWFIVVGILLWQSKNVASCTLEQRSETLGEMTHI